MLTLEFVAASAIALGLAASARRESGGELDPRASARLVAGVAARYARFDRDGDGRLSRRELEALLASLTLT